METNTLTIFCFDSSALIDLHKYYGEKHIPELWKELDSLFNNGKIVSHEIVFNELTSYAKNPSSLSKWIMSKRSSFKAMTGIQAQYVASIIDLFPNLIDRNHEKDQADPWLIALALEEKHQLSLFSTEIIIVSQENPSSPHKIPAVCKHYGIRHFDLFEFFSFNGWELNFKKL
ncbi:DUF4411 family protein [Chloroflexota bacterium]